MGVGLIAGGNVRPKRFVRISGENTVTEATGAQPIFGVSGQYTRNIPYGALDDGFHAIATEPCRVFLPGEVCGIVVGAAVTAGDRVKADGSGRAIPVSANNDQYGGIALQTASIAGAEIEIMIQPGVHGQ